jgi:alpha-glucosidase
MQTRYEVYTKGEKQKVFMTNPDGSLYIGQVWPGYTVFPDWLSANAVRWWVDSMKTWHKEIPFDGIWIDMSEVSSFCVGSCGSGNLILNPLRPPFALPGESVSISYDFPEGFDTTNSTEAKSASAASSSQAAAHSKADASPTTVSYYRPEVTPGVRNINYPPYVLNHVQQGHDLAKGAVSPNATHADGTQEYDVHNLFGHQILNATYRGLTKIFPGKRPFIIGRSTFVGSGVWAGHWGGDNYSKWAYMFFSIPQALSFSLFGIPMFGVDTCGFAGNTDEELCNRWMQLSAFFTFYRNHNVLGAISQEAYVWSSVAKATRDAMHIRFQLLPYIYTLMYQAHTAGSPVMRALAWEFPDDPSLASADRQFLLGPSIMVTPVLVQGATTVNGVFPGAGKGTIWYDWYTGVAVEAVAGQNMTIDAPLGHIPVYVRGGSVLPLQEPALTTAQARKNPWSILAALGSDGKATGDLYVDDGESVAPSKTLWVKVRIRTLITEHPSFVFSRKHLLSFVTKTIKFTTSTSFLSARVEGQFKDNNALSNITILGVPSKVTKVWLDNVDLKDRWTHNNLSKALEIKGLNEVTAGGAWRQSWVLTWE